MLLVCGTLMSNPLHCLIISYQCNFEGNRSWLRVHTPFHMIETFYNLGKQLCFSKIHVCFLQTHAVQKMKVNLILLKQWAYLHNFHVRSFVRPSESPRSYKDWGGFMGHMLLQNCTYTCSKNCHSGRIRAAVPHDIRK